MQQYKLIFHLNKDLFEKNVNDLLRQGWKLNGPTVIMKSEESSQGVEFYQSLVKLKFLDGINE